MVKFNFYEAELINGFFEDVSCEDAKASAIISRIENAIANTDEPELIDCARDTANKLKGLSESEFKLLVDSLPLAEGFSI
jgi:hypothetical protein